KGDHLNAEQARRLWLFISYWVAALLLFLAIICVALIDLLATPGLPFASSSSCTTSRKPCSRSRPPACAASVTAPNTDSGSPPQGRPLRCRVRAWGGSGRKPETSSRLLS